MNLPAKRGNRKSIVLFGDSITQGSFQTDYAGWGGLLSNHLCRLTDVYNRGFSGYNSRWALQILPAVLESFNELFIVVIFFGANDSVAIDDVQHVPLDEYGNNIQSIIDKFRAHDSTVSLIIVTPPAVDSVRWPTRSNIQVSEYADVVRSIARDKSVELVDLWQCPHCINLEDLNDGLHLSMSGNLKVFNGVLKAINRIWPCVVSDVKQDASKHMPMHFPSWKSLAGTNYDESQNVIDNWCWESCYDIPNKYVDG